MDRRQFVQAGIAAGALTSTGFTMPARDDARHYYELRSYELRSDLNPARLRAFHKDAFLPAYARAGAGAVGIFSADTGFASGTLITLVEYASLAAFDSVAQRLDADSIFRDARRSFESGADLPYVRYESRLLRAFTGHRQVEVPATDAARAPRMFELRTYEARSTSALEKKIAMFNGGEMPIFRRLGMLPVFFGENLTGTRLPSLTYMLAYDDIAARTKAWAAFRVDQEWQRLSKDPQYEALGSVTVTNAAYLSPAAFSRIR